MPDRRGRKGSVEDLLPKNRVAWAREIWRDKAEIANLTNGAWMLRDAADALGINQEEVDRLLRAKKK